MTAALAAASDSKCNAKLIDYIYFYNHQRIQFKTKLTPLELQSKFVVWFILHMGFFVLYAQCGVVSYHPLILAAIAT
ncbi:MAG: IS3 family transposase [Ruminococcus sp.]|uniref:IS3 family transposase n=1 Tax=Ruminococcus sp. TaxID=41978 RepID=UPI00344B61A9|nr:IS3 family transposase [Ruminococcus sp.]